VDKIFYQALLFHPQLLVQFELVTNLQRKSDHQI